jgi:hypothetical protein
MKRRSSHVGRQRCRGSRGASLIEAAVMTPVFLLLVFGIIEFGVVYRDYLTIGDATTVGARIGSITGPGLADVRVSDGAGGTVTVEANGDFAAMMAVREDLAAIPIDWIDRIVIFEGDKPSQQTTPVNQVPAFCKNTASIPANGPGCNIYEPREAFEHLEGTIDSADLDYFKCVSSSDPACGWNPDTRANGPTTDDIDYFGIYIKIDRPYLTGIFGDDFTIEQAHILRLEPGPLG